MQQLQSQAKRSTCVNLGVRPRDGATQIVSDMLCVDYVAAVAATLPAICQILVVQVRGPELTSYC